MKVRSACVIAGFLLLILSLIPLTVAQTTTETASALPHLIRFSAVARDLNGNPLTGVLGITFALYSEQTGGPALWIETQNVTADSSGHYVALLGSTKPDGLPADLFNSEQARWVGVQVSGQTEQPRVLLVSAPYALKAGDAETVGGLPPSAFVLAAPPVSGSSVNNAAMASASPSSASSSSASPATSSDVTTTGGTANAVPLFTTSTNIQNSIVTQTGTTSVNVAGALKLPATGTATATAGKNSRPQDFVASSFNISTSAAENQTFQWQAEPASNDTTSPSGTLNLLYGLGATTPSETGLKLSSTGLFTFATGQTFPWTGTITGITTASGSGLAGGGSSGTLSLSVPAVGITNAMLANPSLTVTAGTDLTGGGPVALGSTTTLNLDTTKVPQLAAANTFTGNQTVNGNLSATGAVTGSSFQIGSNLFDYGSYGNGNAFLGFAGNGIAPTGSANTAIGVQALAANSGYGNTATGSAALAQNTSGLLNTANGNGALYSNQNGTGNTASGVQALYSNNRGDSNTATGYWALYNNTAGSNNTANGGLALQSNTEGYENTAIGNGALNENSTGGANTAGGFQALFSNTTGSGNTAMGLNAAYTQDSSYVTGSNNTALGSNAGFSTGSLTYATAMGSNALVSQSNSLVLGGLFGSSSAVNVGIGTSAPSNVFTIAQGAGHAISDGWDTYSSRRWKTNIHTLDGALAKVEQLRGVSYDLKATGKHEVGVIAEEVGAVVPEVVSWEKNGKDAQGVDYSRLTALLIEAVKQQQREIRSQTTDIRNLKSELRSTRQTLAKLQAQSSAGQTKLVASK